MDRWGLSPRSRRSSFRFGSRASGWGSPSTSCWTRRRGGRSASSSSAATTRCAFSRTRRRSPSDEEIAVASSLLLLEDDGFYRSRAASLRALLGGRVERSGRTAGILRDVLLGAGGAVTELELGRGGSLLRVPAHGSSVTSTRADAA